ncbi:MAG: hypothetical protein Q4C30_04465 [Bacteroidia bacterium]|nr:hypothetical protein [Bacteroidia bacterium]
MKKIFKYFTLASIVALSTVACSEDGPDYAGPGEVSQAPGVAFASSAASSYVLTPDESVLKIPISRTNADNAGSFTVTVVKNEDDALVIPSEVSFAAGEKEANLVLTVAPSFEVGSTKELELSLSEDLKSPYTNGASVLVTKVTRDYVWNDLGVATISEGFLGVDMNAHLYQRSDNSSYYRLAYPYNADAYEEAGIIGGSITDGGSTTDYIEFSVIDGVVTWNYWYLGLLYSGIDIVAFQPSYLSSTLSDDNTVVNYKEDGGISYVAFSPYYYVPSLGGFGESEVDLFWPDYVFPSEEEEPAEEAGKDFFAGAALADYLGEYTMTYSYLTNNGKKEITEDVEIVNNGDGTVTLATFDEAVALTFEYFGGLLYLPSQHVFDFPYQGQVFDFNLYMSDGKYIYDDAYFYAGFNEEGVLEVKDYPYNFTTDENGVVVPAPAMESLVVFNSKLGPWGHYADIKLTKKSANKSASLNSRRAPVKRFITDTHVIASADAKSFR